MTQHTPGPWKAINTLGVWIVGRAGGHLLTKIPAGSVDAEANARLMAAAPDLLHACELALHAFEDRWAIDWGVVRAAIDKARGETR